MTKHRLLTLLRLRAYWQNPIVRSVICLIAAIWGGLFTLAIILFAGFGRANWVIVAIVVMTVSGVGASLSLPLLLVRAALRRLLAELEPLPWPLPDLTLPRAPMVPWDVAVVGSGIGSLSAAALLAKAGHRVLVCEAHNRPGGYCSGWKRSLSAKALPKLGKRGTFVFDAGVFDVSGLHDRGGVRALLRHLGVEDALTWLPMEREWVTPERTLVLPHGREALAAALAGCHPAAGSDIAAFLAEMEAIFHDMYGEVAETNGIPRMPYDVDRLMVWPRRHPAAFRWIDRPFTEMLAQFVADPAARSSLSLLTGYLTDRPDTLKVGQMAPIFGMQFVGGHYPAGGSQGLADLLVKVIRDNGGQVRLKTTVSRIVMENGKAVGLALADGSVEGARAVIAGGDAKKMLLDLVGAEHLPAGTVQALQAANPSCSAFMVTLAVDLVPEGAPVKFIGDGVGNDVSVLVPSVVDPALAPPGHAAVTLVALEPQEQTVGWDRESPEYRKQKRARGDALIARAERAIPALSQHILYRQDASARTFERYSLATAGNIYGLALDGYRPHRRTPVEGMFLTGHGTPMGPGVEAVAIAGMLVAEDLGAFSRLHGSKGGAEPHAPPALRQLVQAEI